jgi:hypothetical protein
VAIAAALSRGQVPYTGEKLEPCTVLYASMEHNVNATVLDRKSWRAEWRDPRFNGYFREMFDRSSRSASRRYKLDTIKRAG